VMQAIKSSESYFELVCLISSNNESDYDAGSIGLLDQMQNRLHLYIYMNRVGNSCDQLTVDSV
jgi:hypothetical protein